MTSSVRRVRKMALNDRLATNFDAPQQKLGRTKKRADGEATSLPSDIIKEGKENRVGKLVTTVARWVLYDDIDVIVG